MSFPGVWLRIGCDLTYGLFFINAYINYQIIINSMSLPMSASSKESPDLSEAPRPACTLYMFVGISFTQWVIIHHGSSRRSSSYSHSYTQQSSVLSFIHSTLFQLHSSTLPVQFIRGLLRNSYLRSKFFCRQHYGDINISAHNQHHGDTKGRSETSIDCA